MRIGAPPRDAQPLWTIKVRPDCPPEVFDQLAELEIEPTDLPIARNIAAWLRRVQAR